MKKIIIPTLLSLIAIVLYFFYETEQESYRPQPSEESVEVKYTYKVLSQTESSFSSKEEHLVLPKKLIIKLEEDLNTTRDCEIPLSVEIQNLKDSERYNVFWSEGKKILGMGDTLQQKFSKGEHIITVQVKTTQDREASATMIVTAWDYSKVDKQHFSAENGEALYTLEMLYDHQYNLLLEKTDMYKNSYLYNKEGYKVEEQYEDYQDSSNNYTQYFEYDENGNNISTESLNEESVMVGYESIAYDEEGSLISYKIGKDEYTLKEILSYEDASDVEETQEEEVQENQEQEEDEILYDDNDNIIRYVSTYGDSKFTTEMQYDENNRTTERKYTTEGDDYSYGRTLRYNYDDDGLIKEKEIVFTENNKIVCHFSTSNQYNENSSISKKSNQVFAGDCSDVIENIYEEYQYDRDGNIIALKSKKYDVNNTHKEQELFTTMKVKRYYTNDLFD